MYTQEEYNQRRQDRLERLQAAAAKASAQSAATWQQASLMASIIPFGQPILVGHYSEKRDRNFRAKIEAKHRKGYELYNLYELQHSPEGRLEYGDALFVSKHLRTV